MATKYRMVSSDNMSGVWQAWMNNSLSEDDLKLLLSPNNTLTISHEITETGVKTLLDVSAKPEYKITSETVFGVEKEFGAPFNCTSTITRVGKTGLKDITKYPDGNIYTSTATFTGLGYTSKVCGPNGYIGTVWFEREDPCITGFWVLESHENGDKMIAEDAKISVSAAAELCSNLATRITENNGYYTMTDWMGNGASKTITFKLGEEFEINDASLGMNGTEIGTKTGPGSYSLAYKDSSGKTSVWEATVTEDQMIWKVTKPLNTTCSTFTYRRMADITGNWKEVTAFNNEIAMLEFGMPEAQVKTIAAEKPTHSIKYNGMGGFCWSSDSKAMPIPPITWKSGEEFSYKIQEWEMHEVIVHTKTGIFGSTQIGGKTSLFDCKVGKNFMIIEAETVGSPHTKSVTTLVKV